MFEVTNLDLSLQMVQFGQIPLHTQLDRRQKCFIMHVWKKNASFDPGSSCTKPDWANPVILNLN